MPIDPPDPACHKPPLANSGASDDCIAVIDPAAGTVSELNVPASQFFGVSPSVEQFSIDHAMPAMMELRALVGSGILAQGGSIRRNLLFWTPAGPRMARTACRLEGHGRIRVAFLSGDDRPISTARPLQPRAQEDTATTLSRIARRIRAELAARETLQSAVGRSAEALPAEGSEQRSPELAQHLAKLAHELRTPLSAIAIMSEIIRDEGFGPIENSKYVDYAQNIHDSAKHLISVADGFLDIAAVALGRPEPTFVEMDIRNLITTSVNSIHVLASEAGISLLLELPDRLPHLIADQRAVRQMLLNLLTNALKFTPRGGSVRISAAPGDTGLTIEVADSGPGLRNGNKGEAGPGLGLPMVRALAKENGAWIDLTDSPQGLRAAICFPPSRIVPV